MQTKYKLKRLEQIIKNMNSLLIVYTGGVDSTLKCTQV